MKFDWDENKAKINLTEHQVSFDEATIVFKDVWAIQEYDVSHSDFDEQRITIIGFTGAKILRVTYTVEFSNKNEIIKIISARKAQGLDKKDYERNRNQFDW